MELGELIDLRYEKRDQVGVITLDREEARNAYSIEMIESLVRVLDHIEQDDEVRCVILTGAGSSFSGGGDLKLMQDRAGMFAGNPVQLRSAYLRGIHRVPRRLARFEKPLIAMINGPAIGAGLDLACMCDIRIAANGARMGSTFVKLGLVPGDGGAYLLARVIGFPRALELVMTGRLIDTIEAERIGLVNQVVEVEKGGELMEAAMRTASRICSNAPLAVRLAKSAMYHSWDLNLEGALNLAATYQGIVQNTPDHDEGLAATIERRAPEFSGK